MKETKRPTPLEAAQLVIDKHFPNCQAALLAGSVVRGEATATSDLDMVIFDQKLTFSYRESFIDFGWYIECFVHNFTSYREFFENDCKRAKPSMPKMVSEGIVLRGAKNLDTIKKEANDLLRKGPEKWTIETVNMKRYFLTDVLDDLKGCSKREEAIFLVNALADLSVEFILRMNGQWIGSSKWTIRALKNFDESLAENLVEALEAFYQQDDKDNIIRFAEEILQPYGGLLFNGFSMGKTE
ncbi:nucleotidyltransferase domain-containing protein [Lederbergia sp. NSJ-179]|uniref:nucleotidyltransferase domain-containing protein n=1 Tax=Lederbergia sp. NSJ-179 TaxID=2931402 RepID=UPI001FD4EF30|nr:nucleotidyltransferase domain-containing protein [Lederbergia sp. NSJ-179]MCJ7839792.1 nucleotidyltransferase domain-containing protein [Lederbergia sp. NSJ-179]